MFVIHYGEIGIKGNNRSVFENRLASNIRQLLKGLGETIEVQKKRGIIIVDATDASTKNAEIREVLKAIPGIEYFVEGLRVQPTLEAVIEKAVGLYKEKTGTFRVTAKRADKAFPGTSQELAAKVGEAILNANPNVTVDLHKPDHVCFIEITPDIAYVAPEKIKGVGGLPVGSSGRIVSLLSGGIDSPVASWMMLKRGAPLHYVSFHNFPYTDRSSIDIVKDLVKHLGRTSGLAHISLFNLTPVQEEIVAKCEAKFRVLLYRRMMFRIAERVAIRENAKAFVTGESLGQVASQTVENIAVVEQVTAMPILRPLIGTDKQDIVELAKKIGTYDLSIKPHADCCSLFVPDHPATKARLVDILENEKRLDVEALTELVLKNEELVRL